MTPSVRARGQVLPIVVVVVVTAFTIASSAANLIPSPPRESPAQLRRVEQAHVVLERRVRIAALSTALQRCHPASAHELARLLVMDGQWARVHDFAAAYEQQCGPDPVVRNWGNAPAPRALHGVDHRGASEVRPQPSR